MSSREGIAANIVAVLASKDKPFNFQYVTREPFDFEKLSNAQFPAILVRSGNESREDSTIGGTLTQRQSMIEYQIVCYVKAKEIDSARNNVIDAIEERLDADRTRAGLAVDSQITAVDTDDGSIDPIGGVIVTLQCTYRYPRGNA
tara:strand:+ start:44 stop:478 length:435 start_codon:yes stop_codon:yes gene_type:complete